MWTYEHSIDADVSPTAVWDLYADVSAWPDTWNYGLEIVKLDGPFQDGSTGICQPRGAEALPYTLGEVSLGKHFTMHLNDEDKVITASYCGVEALPDGGSRITHRIELSGPASAARAAELGPILSQGLIGGVQKLVEFAAKAS
jgi:polyketide cyclase/dehydrase/lipid transport protein